MVDLSTYVRVGQYNLPLPNGNNAPGGSELAEEVSAVTYNKDSDTLFVVGDEGTSIVQISKTGQLIDSMSLASGAFEDTEGLTYVGNNQFVLVEERTRSAILFTYEANGTLTRAETDVVTLGTTVGNIGLEGASYDPLTGGFMFVKEKDPTEVFQTDIDFVGGTASNAGDLDGTPNPQEPNGLFDPAHLGVIDIADVFALSNIELNNGNVLLLSQESAQILEVTRTGEIVSVMNLFSDSSTISAIEQGHEGITMDADGNIYVVSENGGGLGVPQMWVFSPATAPNEAPTGIELVNKLETLPENQNTEDRVRVADIAITDDGQGVNTFTVTGADAAHFEADHTGLYLKAGTDLDYETKASYSVTVNVNDPNVGTDVDASTSYTLNLTDVNEGSGGPSGIFISEVAPWSSGDSPVGADWFEITNAGTEAVDLTGWKVDDNSNSFNSAIALSGITSIAAGESVIFIEGSGSGVVDAFVTNWFGASRPAGLQIGTYSGSGIGLGTGGDALNIYNASGTLQANVTFGTSTTGRTFDNAAGIDDGAITNLALISRNGGFESAGASNEIGSPSTVGRLFISEVAPWSNDTPVGADWFEVTNGTASAINLSGWKMDDNSANFANAVALNGVTTIAAGETVIFLENANPTTAIQTFVDTWFGGTAPAGLQFGTYTGSGVGLSANGDAVNLYDRSGTLQASVSVGASGTNNLTTFENATALNGVTLTARSTIGSDSPAFAAANASTQIGSPGEVVPVNAHPIASDDVLSDQAGSASRTISFASLLSNDNAGANESGQTLTISGVSNAVGGTVAIVGTDVIFTPTSGFTGTASFDYVVRDNGVSYGVNDFRTDTGSVSFGVTAEADAPVFTSAAQFDAAENQLVAGTLAATDPQSDPITYSIVGGADQNLFSVNAQTGIVSFVTAPDFEAPADANHDNAYVLSVRASDGTNTTDQTVTINVTDVAERAEIYVTEVAPWSSSSPVGQDWFELTNRGTTAIDVTGWKMDDNSNSAANAAAMSGITSIAAGESVIYIEAAAGQSTATIANFVDTWFGGTLPAGLQIGTYTGSGVGLSGSGDAVNIYNGAGALQANVTFGASSSGPVYQTFKNDAYANNSAITTLSTVGTDGAFRADDDANEIGSPGSVGRLFISEVAPASSSSAVGADWFEVTNSTSSAIDITGWKVDDSSAIFANALALNGITSIAAGETVIFLESANPTATIQAFVDTWFGGTAPDGLRFGTYTGGGIGLSTGGDAVNLYNASGVLQASVSFGTVSGAATLENSAGLNGVAIGTQSAVGINGAVSNDDGEQIGSPGVSTRNDAPVTAADIDAVDEDASVTGNVLTNDSDPQTTDTLSVLSVGGIAIDGATEIKGIYGTLTINGDGSYSYAADGDRVDALATGQQRDESFSYVVSDGNGGRTTETLSITVTAIDDTVVVSVPTGEASFTASDDDEAVTITTDDDFMVFGMGGADILEAAGGNDTLAGGAGDDIIVGGEGNNYLFGGSMAGGGSEGGNDTLIGGGGADHIYGNSVSGAGNDVDGDDLIETGNGVNYANGAAGDDIITGGAGRDRLYGGADNDSLSGAGGNDQINGNQGDDTILGGDGNDSLRGGQGDDLIFGDGGNDILKGELGNDTLVAGAGVDVMTGGAGNDLFDLSRPQAGNVDLAGFYTAITDFQQGADHIDLGFAVGAGDVLQAGSFRTVAAAQTAALELLTNHSGTQDVAAAQVGTSTFLFYNAEGSDDQITGVLALYGTTATAIEQTDFI